jgi:hypothetical protein
MSGDLTVASESVPLRRTQTLPDAAVESLAAAVNPPWWVAALVAEPASKQSALSALHGALTARLLVSHANAAAQPEQSDRLLTAEEVATTLGVTKRWV